MTVGEQLKQRRIELGLSLEEISSEIKISPKILEKIENNEPQPTIAPAILKGFIRSYSKHLRLETDPNLIASIAATSKSKKTNSGLLEFEEASSMSWLKWGLSAGVVIVIAVGLKVVQKYKAETYSQYNQAPSELDSEKMIMSKSEIQKTLLPIQTLINNNIESVNPHSIDAPIKSQESESAMTDINVQQDSKTFDINASTETDRAVEQSVTRYKEVILEAKKDTSIRIKSQDKIAIEKLLESGKYYLFREAIPFTLKSEDPSALQVIVNGRIMHSPKSSSGPMTLEIKE